MADARPWAPGGGSGGGSGAGGGTGPRGLQGNPGAGYEVAYQATASATAPAAPADASAYGTPGGDWSAALPTLTTTNRWLWRSQRQVAGTPNAGDAVSSSWSSPALFGYHGADGEDGEDGTSAPGGGLTAIIAGINRLYYFRAASLPTTGFPAIIPAADFTAATADGGLRWFNDATFEIGSRTLYRTPDDVPAGDGTLFAAHVESQPYGDDGLSVVVGPPAPYVASVPSGSGSGGGPVQAAERYYYTRAASSPVGSPAALPHTITPDADDVARNALDDPAYFNAESITIGGITWRRDLDDVPGGAGDVWAIPVVLTSTGTEASRRATFGLPFEWAESADEVRAGARPTATADTLGLIYLDGPHAYMTVQVDVPAVAATATWAEVNIGDRFPNAATSNSRFRGVHYDSVVAPTSGDGISVGDFIYEQRSHQVYQLATHTIGGQTIRDWRPSGLAGVLGSFFDESAATRRASAVGQWAEWGGDLWRTTAYVAATAGTTGYHWLAINPSVVPIASIEEDGLDATQWERISSGRFIAGAHIVQEAIGYTALGRRPRASLPPSPRLADARDSEGNFELDTVANPGRTVAEDVGKAVYLASESAYGLESFVRSTSPPASGMAREQARFPTEPVGDLQVLAGGTANGLGGYAPGTWTLDTRIDGERADYAEIRITSTTPSGLASALQVRRIVGPNDYSEGTPENGLLYLNRYHWTENQVALRFRNIGSTAITSFTATAQFFVSDSAGPAIFPLAPASPIQMSVGAIAWFPNGRHYPLAALDRIDISFSGAQIGFGTITRPEYDIALHASTATSSSDNTERARDIIIAGWSGDVPSFRLFGSAGNYWPSAGAASAMRAIRLPGAQAGTWGGLRCPRVNHSPRSVIYVKLTPKPGVVLGAAD